MNLSLRFWLIVSFFIVTIISLTTLLLFITNQNRIDNLEEYINTLQRTRIALLETNRIKEDIFISELINPNFHEKKKSSQELRLDD